MHKTTAGEKRKALKEEARELARDARAFLNKSKNDTDWVIVDIRQPEDYFQGHIKGVINIPFNDLIANMKIIPAGKKVAVYYASNKRSPYSVMALRIFDDRNAWVLLDGVSAWKAAGQ